MLVPKPDERFIFVSYSSKDSSFVHEEIERLERQHFSLWFDSKLEAARLWDKEISERIEACACFIVFVTEDSVASEKVRAEIKLALEAGKPLIGIYWDDVELPPPLQAAIRTRQTLDRTVVHRSTYVEPLTRALSKYIQPETPVGEDSDTPQNRTSLTPVPSDVLPRIVFFSLILLGTLSLLLAFVATITPYVPSQRPDDPLNNRWIGFLAGLFFVVIAVILGAGAFIVHRVYLGKKDG